MAAAGLGVLQWASETTGDVAKGGYEASSEWDRGSLCRHVGFRGGAEKRAGGAVAFSLARSMDAVNHADH